MEGEYYLKRIRGWAGFFGPGVFAWAWEMGIRIRFSGFVNFGY